MNKEEIALQSDLLLLKLEEELNNDISLYDTNTREIEKIVNSLKGIGYEVKFDVVDNKMVHNISKKESKVKQFFLGVVIFFGWFISYAIIDSIIFYIKEFLMSGNDVTNIIVTIIAITTEAGIMLRVSLYFTALIKKKIEIYVFASLFAIYAILYIGLSINIGTIPYNVIIDCIASAIPILGYAFTYNKLNE